ncbi:MAG TPA: type II secretion system F family protein [Armatimonadota bacterium]|nr:type II secretion system F family protein [Armatimonadota bacterium]
MESRIPAPEMAHFCRQFGTMLSADVNLLPVVATLRQQTGNEYLREVLLGVQEDLEMGVPLAVAFSRYPQDFSPFFIQLVRQGEIEGALPDVLQRLADHYEAEARGGLSGSQPEVTVNLDMALVVEALRPLILGLLLAVSVVAVAVAGVLYLTAGGIIPADNLAPNIVLTVSLSVVLAALLVHKFRPRLVHRCSFCGRLDSEVEEMVSSGGVSICGECVVRTVQRMRRTQRPAEVASPAPSALADEAEEARRRERADRVAFRDPQELIDLSVDSSDEDSTA